MSTHRSVSRKKGSGRLSVCTCVGGWLIALQMWLALSSTAFAAPQAPEALTGNAPYNLARAGVSVVRLLVTYGTPANPDQNGAQSATPNQVVCSGLGVIVASWPTTVSAMINTWVLTDSSLLTPTGPASCVGDHPDMEFQAVEVVTSDFYNSAQTITFTTDRAASVKCLLTCSGNAPLGVPVLIGFSSKPQNAADDFKLSGLPAEPYVDLPSSASSLSIPGSALTLDQGNTSFAQAPLESNIAAQLSNYQRTAAGFRSPVFKAMTDIKELEPGTPVINQNGELTELELKEANNVYTAVPIAPAALQTAISGISATQQNTVHTSWNTGLNAFYGQNGTKKNLDVAAQSFTTAARANPNFKGASDFAQLASSQSNSSSSPATNSSVQPSTFLGMELWQVALAGLALLLILLAVVTMLFRRSRVRPVMGSGFTAEELAEADRRATIEAQRIKELEMQQTVIPAPMASPPAPPVAVPVSAQSQGPVRELRCPNCNAVVPHDANFCPQCRMWLSPSESGLHLRLVPQQPAPGSAPVSPIPAIAEQPTLPPSAVPVSQQAAFAEQPTIPVGGLKASTLAEQPTIEVKPKGPTRGLDSEKTQPYTKRSNGTRLGFVVGTRSDPGIKRQYKPNEDSLFAAQGFIQAPNPLPFGLFVVADGMGGHANGQDASRLAIQTAVSYILPRLFKAGIASGDVYTHLLAEGIQSANQAVHQRNMDKGGDMGTTVTAALLVEATAYVSNVGDSRTYLYRESEGGLTKITNDHSVVASLVEAGIIKPDDIYTHPKRSHIYRSLGEKAAIEVDNFTVPLQESDKMLLCSDGLWDMVRDPQIEEVVRAPQEPKATCENLIQAAYAGGGEDNVSVILVQIARATKSPKGARVQVLAMPDSFQMPTL